MKLSDADKFYAGSSLVAAIYAGGTKVWPIAAPGPTPHAYWRIYITANNGATLTAIQEVEMRASIGGADQCDGGSPSASSQFQTSFSPDKAFNNIHDGSNECWGTTAAGSVPSWLQYHFASAVVVTELAMWPEGAATNLGRAPKDFKLQWSDDGSSWNDALTVAGATAWTVGSANTYAVP